MPPWDNKFVCQSYLVNEILQQVIEDENNNKDKQQPKFSRQVPKKVSKQFKPFRSNFFTENFFFDPLNVFPKPMGIISNRIM